MTKDDLQYGTGPLRWLLAVNALFAAGLFVHAFLYNFYLERLGYTPLEMGRAQAALTAGGLLALLPAGRLVDRLGARAAAMGASAATALGLALGALAESQGPILLAAALAGAGAASWRVAGGPLMLAVARPAERARGFSWSVGFVVATGGLVFAASGAAPDLLVRQGMTPLAAQRAVLLVGAALTALAVAGYARLSDASAAAALQPDAALPGPLSERQLALVVIAILVWMLASAAAGPFFNLYFARAHRLSLTTTGALLGFGHLATAVALFASAEVALRRGTAVALRGWLVVLAPALLALALAPPLALAGLLYFVQGCVAPATNPLIDQLVLERAAPARRGAVASWRNAATETSGVVGAAAGGALLAASGFTALFAGAAAVALVGAALVAWTLTRSPRTS